jgi:hypothetical protein
MKIVPADDTMADLKRQRAEYEAQARKEAGTVARLREKAAQCRPWLAELKSGKWIS